MPQRSSMAMCSVLSGAFCATSAVAQFTATRLQSDPLRSSRVYVVRDGAMGGESLSTAYDPVVWPSVSASPTNLNPFPGGITGGRINAMVAGNQFGSWGGHAAMWAGTAESYTDLNPVGSEYSEVLAASSTLQAGWTDFLGEESKATLWSGSAASAVYLQPPGATFSKIRGVTETHQAGYAGFPGQPGQGSVFHAALWSGTAASFVDLNPPGQLQSDISGMIGNQQVGASQAGAGAPGLAAMWFGTPSSYVNMHRFTDGLSAINATCGSAQVGYMNSVSFGAGAGVRAAIWFGTAESVYDLSQFLPAGASQSIATCVEEVNGVFTVGGYARYGLNDQPFVWVGVPAPGGWATLVIACCGAFRRRRTCDLNSPALPAPIH